MGFQSKPSVKCRIHFGDHKKVGQVRAQIISSLQKRLSFKEAREEETCDVKINLCPIVSRAGTDIEAALRGSSDTADKLTIMLVLHHTFDPEATVPRSSKYEQKNLMMVDALFHENFGFLGCTRNEEALNRIADHLTRHYAQAPESKAKILKWILWVGVTLSTGVLIYNLPSVWGGTNTWYQTILSFFEREHAGAR